MLLRCIVLFCGVFLLNACGKNEVVENKRFHFFVNTENPETKDAVQFLVDRYNGELGSPVLDIVEDQAAANSKIGFTSNLKLNADHKLGVGQWITISSRTSRYSLEGRETTTEIQYGMDISFDKDNFEAKQARVKDAESSEADHLYHLFCHEVGHGMQLNHKEDDPNDVMYPFIPEASKHQVEYDLYFTQIRTFLGTR